MVSRHPVFVLYRIIHNISDFISTKGIVKQKSRSIKTGWFEILMMSWPWGNMHVHHHHISSAAWNQTGSSFLIYYSKTTCAKKSSKLYRQDHILFDSVITRFSSHFIYYSVSVQWFSEVNFSRSLFHPSQAIVYILYSEILVHPDSQLHFVHILKWISSINLFTPPHSPVHMTLISEL